MTFRPVPLGGPITLVPTERAVSKAGELAAAHPGVGLPADPERLVAELNARPDGVAATFSEPYRQGGDWNLLLYLPTCTVRLFQTQHGDAYRIGAINLLRIRDHHALARGCLLIRPTAWQLSFDLRSIHTGSDSHWPALTQEWMALQLGQATRLGAQPITQEQAVFLDTLDQTIDADERISMAAADATPAFPYRDVTATGERRQGTNSIYVFTIAGERLPEQDAFVQIRGLPDTRGQVTRVTKGRATVRFDQPVDWSVFAAARQGELELTASRVVFAKQREAVASLRTRQAHNTTLLQTVVNHTVSEVPPTDANPTERLDPEQLDAFRKGLTTDDILVVLGPPGTGKTRVISQLACAAAVERGERVLVTSHTHRAVDNVIVRLSGQLEVIRVGHEGSVTADGRPYLLENRAAELRQRVLDDPAQVTAAYDGLDTARQWTARLETCVAALETAQESERQAKQSLTAARRAAGGEVQRRVDDLTSERDRLRTGIDRNTRTSATLARRLDTPPWIWVALGLTLLWSWRRARADARAERLTDTWREVSAALAQAERELEEVTGGDPAVLSARTALRSATDRTQACLTEARQAATAAHTAIAPAISPPPTATTPPTTATPSNASTPSSATTPPTAMGPGAALASGVAAPPPVEDVVAFLGWLRETLPLLAIRAELLKDWNSDIGGAPEQLHPELLRYADVIAATCIGTASRPEMSGIDFDLAIMDEAGQIGLANALVPLARARRAVLVGDDKQLPPFLDSEVEAWGASVDDPLVRELLARSALERLVRGLPSDHVVQLITQRRMPEIVASFVSRAFYQGRLKTAVRREHRDSIFGKPMVFVDTAELPGRERFERRTGRGERWGLAGYVNEAEARLLVELAVHYQRAGADWAVIVPYRAQAKRIITDLARRLGGSDLVGLNVGTVDSFQGGEREVILYGFTRSNSAGRVGFLTELRRANVAFTRAQRLLILVGDMSTLTRATDLPFR